MSTYCVGKSSHTQVCSLSSWMVGILQRCVDPRQPAGTGRGSIMFFAFFFFFNLLPRQREQREIKRKRDLASTSLLPNDQKARRGPGLSWEIGIPPRPLTWGQKPCYHSALWDTSAGGWIGSVLARTRTSAHMRYWHTRGQLNPLSHKCLPLSLHLKNKYTLILGQVDINWKVEKS